MAKRVFLVGCARSGTTLFQSMLAAHPLICSFPETQFFPVLVGGEQERMQVGLENRDSFIRGLLKKIRVSAGIAFPRHKIAMNQLRAFSSDVELEQPLQASSLSFRSYVELFVRMMDEYAERAGAVCWVEKTPNHLYYIDEIERYIEGACFLHIVRKGEDVVASICDAAAKKCEGNDFSTDIDINIQRWNSAVTVTEQYCRHNNHKALGFEALVADPSAKLKEVCKFLDVDYSSEMISSRVAAAQSIIRSEESWKEGVSGEIEKSRPSKFDEVFTKSQQRYVRDRLKTPNFSLQDMDGNVVIHRIHV